MLYNSVTFVDCKRLISFVFGLLQPQKIWLQSWECQVSVTAQFYGIIPNNPQLVQDGQSGKEDVADERNDSQLPVQLPAVDVHGHEKEDDGKEQGGGNEDQPGAVHLHGVVGVHKGGLDEPRQAKAQHVKNV